VSGVVDAVLDLLPLAIQLTLFRSIALHITVDMNLYHLVWREKSVADALFQRVGINRRAEIIDIRDIFGFLRRCGKADLRRRGEVFEYFTPSRILGCTAAMALVDHD